ncbi:3-deoxy-D-manno-octulosonate 8-phosphate phosphatase [hydrothermal vent metagenome]|uniref:3-deoxy-D-manno-octulosonate 8-phosphate phosphatase KdsC n=1 Tax=hydrothermal vent metagenome TaxID=652676 RepID=A0A3B1BGX5_9ZZZZ
MQSILEKAARIRLVIFDVDGVLTDGRLYLGNNGEEFKTFNIKDGLGMKLLMQSGVEIGIITGRSSELVARRMASLGIKHVYQGQQEKTPAYERLLDELGLDNSQTAFVGDDLIDLPLMRMAGLAITVQDAHPLVQQHAHWQSTAPGGHGAAREVCELIMKAQGTLDKAFQAYL